MKKNKIWKPGSAPISVIMISLNEGHNLKDVCENLSGWAQEVILVDSYSKDDTIDIALNYGVKVVQRRFRGFGDQWNFALNELSINSPWVMKLDPDERLTNDLKKNISSMINENKYDAFSLNRRLWFIGKPLPICQNLIRIWKTGTCHFTDVLVNEHPVVSGSVGFVDGDLEHYDSPSLDHWVEKQNRYTTSEAVIKFKNKPLSDKPTLLGTRLQRRMWIKKNFYRMPFRYSILFVYHFIFQGAYRAGKSGYIWAKLRSDVMRMVEYKHYEMKITNASLVKHFYGAGKPDGRVKNYY